MKDRTKPASKPDVVHFIMPERPVASVADEVLCTEVKVKSTTAASNSIQSAIDDCAKDRVSRLATILAWSRERTITEDLSLVALLIELHRTVSA